MLGAGEKFERDDDDPRHDRADREDDSERDAVRGEEHREAEDDEGERQDRGVQARPQLRRRCTAPKLGMKYAHQNRTRSRRPLMATSTAPVQSMP